MQEKCGEWCGAVCCQPQPQHVLTCSSRSDVSMAAAVDRASRTGTWSASAATAAVLLLL